MERRLAVHVEQGKAKAMFSELHFLKIFKAIYTKTHVLRRVRQFKILVMLISFILLTYYAKEFHYAQIP